MTASEDRPDSASSGSPSADEGAPGHTAPGGTVVVGVVTDPGVTAATVEHLVDELPRQLTRQVDDTVTWQVRTLRNSVPLDEHGRVPLLSRAQAFMPAYEWSYMFCLTDLPRFVGGQPAVGDFSTTHRAGQISLPALGWWRVRTKICDVITYLLAQITHTPDSSDSGQDMVRRVTSSVRQVPAGEEEVDAYLMLGGTRGRLELLSGMVFRNRPWRLAFGLSSAAAAAGAAAAFGFFFSTVWSLADAMHPARLAGVTVFALAIMMSWLVIYNNLWEQPAGRRGRQQTVFYNTSTLISLTVGVLGMYLTLFLFALAGTSTVITVDYLSSVLGHSVDWGDYAQISWLCASMGTVAGALGSGLETENAVRRVVYGRQERQHQRDRQHDNTGTDEHE